MSTQSVRNSEEYQNIGKGLGLIVSMPAGFVDGLLCSSIGSSVQFTADIADGLNLKVKHAEQRLDKIETTLQNLTTCSDGLQQEGQRTPRSRPAGATDGPGLLVDIEGDLCTAQMADGRFDVQRLNRREEGWFTRNGDFVAYMESSRSFGTFSSHSIARKALTNLRRLQSIFAHRTRDDAVLLQLPLPGPSNWAVLNLERTKTVAGPFSDVRLTEDDFGLGRSCMDYDTALSFFNQQAVEKLQSLYTGVKIGTRINGGYDIYLPDSSLMFVPGAEGWLPPIPGPQQGQFENVTALELALRRIASTSSPQLAPGNWKVEASTEFGLLVRGATLSGMMAYFIVRSTERGQEYLSPHGRVWKPARGGFMGFTRNGQALEAFYTPGAGVVPKEVRKNGDDELGVVWAGNLRGYWIVLRGQAGVRKFLSSDGFITYASEKLVKNFNTFREAADALKALKLPSPKDAEWRKRAFVCGSLAPSLAGRFGAYYLHGVAHVFFLNRDGTWASVRGFGHLGLQSAFDSREAAQAALDAASSPV